MTERAYDLALRVKDQGFALTIRNRGITLSDERLDWTFEGRADAARLDSIVQVHLQTGGAWMEEGPIAMCRITFRDGYTLTVSDVDKAGLKDETRAEIYRAFVRDLHGRLAELDSAARFTAGYGETQFRVIAVCAVLLGAMGIGIPVVAFLLRPEVEVLLLLGGGIALTVPLFTMLLKNSRAATIRNTSPPNCCRRSLVGMIFPLHPFRDHAVAAALAAVAVFFAAMTTVSAFALRRGSPYISATI